MSTLRSFLGPVQFYSKFLPPTFASVAEPLYRLTRKGHRWAWGIEEEAAFRLPHRGGVRNVFARTFLVHVWHKCRGADCFCQQMIYSTPRVDLFCALCTSWSVAKYCRLCWRALQLYIAIRKP